MRAAALQPGYSVVQFVIPKGKPAGLSIVPSDDAYVAAGANQGRNYGTSSSLYTALSSTSSQSSTTATFLRFPVTKVAAGHVSRRLSLHHPLSCMGALASL